jgi:hypothetical protein
VISKNPKDFLSFWACHCEKIKLTIIWLKNQKLSKTKKNKNFKLDTVIAAKSVADQEVTCENLVFADYVLGTLFIEVKFQESKKHHGNQQFKI